MKKDLQVSELCDTYGGLLTKKQCDILKNYYDFDLSLAEIAENYGITRQAVRDTIVKASEMLHHYESILNILQKKEMLSELVNKAIDYINLGRLDDAKRVIAKMQNRS